MQNRKFFPGGKSACITADRRHYSRSKALIIGFIFTGISLLSPLAQAKPPSEHWAPGRVLVQPQAGIGTAQMEEIIRHVGGRKSGRIPRLNIHIINVPPNAEDAVIAALSHNKNINFAEKDYLLKFDETTANDPYFDDAWHLPKIGAPAAWDHSVGDGVIVAVLDTGVDSSHADLQGQLVPGWNIYDNNPDTSDVNGHGTMVSGVVAALSNNNKGVTSVAWNARVMPVRISQLDGSAYTSHIANGVTYAADNGANLANISYGASGSSSVRSAADYMRSKGGLVFVSAGNSGNESGTSPHPAIITVSATTSSDSLASWSTYGNFVDVSAPGSGIWTTRRGGGYQAVSGTSFSSPVTAAVAALVMAGNSALSPQEVESILMDTSEDLGTPGQDIYFGHGRINAAAAVAAAVGGTGGNPEPDPEDDPVQDTAPPSVNILSPSASAVVSGRVNIEISASDNVGVVRIECSIDGSLKSVASGNHLSYTWNTRKVANGAHVISAIAFDAAGNTSTMDLTVTKGGGDDTGGDTGGGGSKGRGKGGKKK